MTERERLLEAVADAARKLDRFPPGVPGDGRIVGRADLASVWHALDALDALPAQPQPAGETVVLAMWKSGVDSYAFTDPEARELFSKMTEWTRLGTTTLRLDTEVRT